MNRIRYLIVLACAAMLPQLATALPLDPCDAAGQALILPTYPRAVDPVGFTLIVPSPFNSLPLNPYPQYTYYWVKQSQANTNTFVVDLILTDDTTTFPGYTLVDKGAQNWGFLGPLPAGTYTILATVNVFDPASGTIHPECDPATYGPAQRASTLLVWALDDPRAQTLRVTEVLVVEYYNATFDDYFLTTNPAEMQVLDEDGYPSWQRTGYGFFSFEPTNFQSSAGHTNVLRYYGLPSAGINSHFFTFENAESASLSPAWVLETDGAFEIWEPLRATGYCPPNTLPVYRLASGSKHRYTIDPSVKADMIAKGWIPEGYGPNGVVMCSPAV